MNTKFEISFREGNGPFEIEEYGTKGEADARAKELAAFPYNSVMVREVTALSKGQAQSALINLINSSRV